MPGLGKDRLPHPRDCGADLVTRAGFGQSDVQLQGRDQKVGTRSFDAAVRDVPCLPAVWDNPWGSRWGRSCLTSRLRTSPMTTANLVENAGINPREAEILQLMIDGCTNRQMAATLFISESTVKKYVNAIYHKPGVSNRMGLAAPLCCHRRLGLIPRTDAHDIKAPPRTLTHSRRPALNRDDDWQPSVLPSRSSALRLDRPIIPRIRYGHRR